MNRKKLLRHLLKNGCEFFREGGNHTVYANRGEKKVSSVPRHKEIDENLCRKICKDLGIKMP